MWTRTEINEHLNIINGKKKPTIVLKNITYLHSIFKTWEKGNIWIYRNRIIYVGEALPSDINDIEMYDGTGQYAVPGYFEPHAHPFQLYNMETLAKYASKTGTTTFLSDNIAFVSLSEEKRHALLNELDRLPFQFYWWNRIDSQSLLHEEETIFNEESMEEWLHHRNCIMTGEVTAWPPLLHGSERLEKMAEKSVQHRIKMEAHLPGASEKTLVQMKLLQMSGDHESMNAEDVRLRLQHGYGVTLRHSSIRPDLRDMLKEIVANGWDVFDHLMMTTDGSTPLFYTNGVMNQCIEIAIEEGVNPIDAYQMASYNIARYYNIADEIGLIATGRKAMINILSNPRQPKPDSVISDGKWIVKDKVVQEIKEAVTWNYPEFPFQYDETKNYFANFSSEGIELVNDVITKQYKTTLHGDLACIAENQDECFLTLLDKHGEYVTNSWIKNFANVDGLASSNSISDDIVVIGKNKKAMEKALEALSNQGGGIVLIENDEVIFFQRLEIGGFISNQPMEEIQHNINRFNQIMKNRGFKFGDILFCLLFLRSIHLPYIRITPEGMFDVMNRDITFPKRHV